MSLPQRTPDYPIHPIFVERWSRRSYEPTPIPDEVLFTVFEAARWAPSSTNGQPWRFLYAKRDTENWPVFLDLLFERNQLWAGQASALIAVISKRTGLRDGEIRVLPTHSFDTGAAWANLALQASLLGWSTRAIGGFDRERAPGVLGVPEDFRIEILLALGKPGDKDALPDALRKLEAPNSRKPLAEFVREGLFQE